MDRGKEKSGVIAQPSIAIPALFISDARCSTTGGGMPGIGQRQVGYRLEHDCDVARPECGNRLSVIHFRRQFVFNIEKAG